MMKKRSFEAVLDEEYAGMRLDKVLAEVFPFFSRAFLQGRIKSGNVLVDGRVPKPRDIVSGKEYVVFESEPIKPDDSVLQAEALPLDIVHEDDDILVVNKVPGMVVHPGAGHKTGTLMNGLLGHNADLFALPRGGIIHRLDKDTSGLLVVAKTREAHKSLTEQMHERQIRREYWCLVCGELVAGGTVEAPLGRHPTDRKRIAVVHGGLPAVSHYLVEKRFKGFTLLRVRLETGRTHQIRVHLKHIRYPVFGDPVYGGRFRSPAGMTQAQLRSLASFKRQALHAFELELTHPTSRETCVWKVDMPDDMQSVLDILDER